MDNMHIIAMSHDRTQLEAIRQALRAVAGDSRVTAMEASPARIGGQDLQVAGDILIADCDGDDGSALTSLEAVADAHPRMAIIVLRQRQTPEFLLRALRLGVREVLASPADAAQLAAAVQRIAQRHGRAAPQGRILAFASCKGGSGATFLASNLAWMLAADGDARVALIDLNLQFGDAHMFLSERRPSQTLADVVRGIHRLDAALLKASMSEPAPGLAVLAAPDDPSHGLEVGADHVATLLTLARAQYDYVILDLGRTVDAATVRALDHADRICAVMQASLPFVRGARRLLDVFCGLEYPDHKVELIVNRHHGAADIGIKSIESALGRAVARAVPNDYEAACAAVNQGVPIARVARGSPVAGALQAWAAQLQGRAARAEANWIARVFKRA